MATRGSPTKEPVDNFVNDVMENDNEQADEPRFFNILDGLTEHRAERAQILLKNLYNEDLVHIDLEKIPAFLRIDGDVTKKRLQLIEFHNQYQTLDMTDMDREIKQHLNRQVQGVSKEFKTHKDNVTKLLQEGELTNKNSLALHNDTVNMRVNQNENISSAMAESAKQIHDFDVQNSDKDQLRNQVTQMQKQLRDLNVQIAKDKIALDNMKNVTQAEKELRSTRDSQERETLAELERAQSESIDWTKDQTNEIQQQDKLISQMTSQLQETMNKRQNNNVTDLIKAIEADKRANQDALNELNRQLKDIDGEYLKYKNENQRLQSQVSKMQESFRELQEEEQEKQSYITGQVQQLEIKIREQNDTACQSIRDLALTQKELQRLKNESETLQNKIEIQQGIMNFHEACQYEKRIADLTNTLTKSQSQSEYLEKELQDQSTKWQQIYQEQQANLKAKIEQESQNASLEHIRDLVSQITAKETEIKDIQSEVDQILAEQQDKINDSELEELKLSVQKKITDYKLLLNDKAVLFEEMYSRALLMVNRDAQIVQNQQEIVQLKHEIDINILEIEQKSAIITELQGILKQKKEHYKQLKKEIKEIEQQCEELSIILKQKEDELETLEDVLRDKDVIIEGLEKTLGEKAPQLGDNDKAKKTAQAAPKIYSATSGDAVDELLAKYINSMEVNVPIRREEPGFYMFGTRKIYAKVMNNKLVVRVGGGFMSFQDFINTYAIAEQKRINELIASGDWDIEAFLAGGYKDDTSPMKRKTMAGRASVSPMRMQGRISPQAPALAKGRQSPNNYRGQGI